VYFDVPLWLLCAVLGILGGTATTGTVVKE